ncbi:hypothetical protein DPEC_G00120000 [Dallia pectoralis]|uniref:Uncharacterized protein n=1 Tax=Dallia pectoralis TaxID=75939 RepID=A0ACC2GPZ2_DALPE|nr:hypothetical protein DPEC_G00120000 [Dallia pectoralis]
MPQVQKWISTHLSPVMIDGCDEKTCQYPGTQLAASGSEPPPPPYPDTLPNLHLNDCSNGAPSAGVHVTTLPPMPDGDVAVQRQARPRV